MGNWSFRERLWRYHPCTKNNVHCAVLCSRNCGFSSNFGLGRIFIFSLVLVYVGGWFGLFILPS